MSKKIIISAGLAAALALAGTLWLRAVPQDRTPLQQQHQTIIQPSGSAAEDNTLASSTSTAAGPVIGLVSIAPETLAANSSQPVVITATIGDPTVITNSVNLVQILPSGLQTILGTLHDDGIDGDLVAGDGTYTIRRSFSSFPIGTTTLQISAAFVGVLRRVQTEPFFLYIAPSQNTTGWVTLSDSLKLFSIMVPPTWHLTVAETSGPSDAPAMEDVQFSFPDGTPAFIVSVYTHQGWIDQQSQPSPLYLGQNGTYVFGIWMDQEPPQPTGLDPAQIGSMMAQVRATFHIN